MKCKICGNKSEKIFQSIILKKYTINYYHCPICSFLQTEEPYWLDEAYNDTINLSDTGLVKRNQDLARISASIIYFLFHNNAQYIDYSGGYGLFVRLMRDIGFDFYWNDKYTHNIFAKGFEHSHSSRYELLTSFEAMEHFSNPMSDIATMLDLSDNIIVSTNLFKGSPPSPHEWWYYGLNHGQHISFFSEKTLNYIAGKHNLFLLTNGSTFHLLTKKKISGKLFRILLQYNNCGIFRHVKNKMKSLTVRDSELLRTIDNLKR